MLKDKITMLVLAMLAYLIPFSARTALWEYEVLGAGIINDFTRVFLFGIDLAVVAAIAALVWTTQHSNILENIAMFANFVRKKMNVVIKFTVGTLAAFIIWSGISLLAAPEQTLLGLAFLTRFILAAILFILILRIPSKFSFAAITVGLVIGGIVQSFTALAQFGLQKSIGLFVLGESPLMVGMPGVATFTALGDKFLRAYGTLPHPNNLAFYLMATLFFCITAYFMFSERKHKIAVVLTGVLISIGLVLTFSRIFIILAALGLIFLVVLNVPTPSARRGKLYYMGGLILFLLIFFSLNALRPVGADESLTLRILYSDVTTKQSALYPFSGTGLGQSIYLGNQVLQNTLAEQNLIYQTWMHQPVHSTFMLLRAETGWIGLSLFLLFLVFTTDKLIKAVKHAQSRREKTRLQILGILIILTFIAMFFEHLFITSPNMFYLIFILLGLFMRAKNETLVQT